MSRGRKVRDLTEESQRVCGTPVRIESRNCNREEDGPFEKVTGNIVNPE